jgi:hypothetical protein
MQRARIRRQQNVAEPKNVDIIFPSILTITIYYNEKKNYSSDREHNNFILPLGRR